jgi:membrane-bound serine protease (ClpP class)
MITLAAVILALTVLPAPWGVIAVAGAFGADVLETVVLVRWSRRRRAAVGAEALVGRRGLVVRTLAPQGQVRLDGELWQARAERVVEPGQEVVVRRVDGLVLHVEAETECGSS